jgi:predicted transcriptional regulator
MARKKSSTLTDLETDIMNIVWQQGEVTVRDVYETIRETRHLAYTTVLTVLGTLTKKGIVHREMKNRTYMYRPKMSHDEAVSRNLQYLAGKFFGGSAHSLAAHIVESEKLSRQELEELHKVIKEKLKEESEI